MKTIKKIFSDCDIECPEEFLQMFTNDIKKICDNLSCDYYFSKEQLFEWFNDKDYKLGLENWLLTHNSSQNDCFENNIENDIEDTINYIINKKEYERYDDICEKIKDNLSFLAHEFICQSVVSYSMNLKFYENPNADYMECNIYIGSFYDENTLGEATIAISNFLKGNRKSLEEKHGDTGLIWLLHTQGYKLSDLKNIYGKTEYDSEKYDNGKYTFLESMDIMFQEANNIEQYGIPYLQVSITPDDFWTLKNGDNIEINKNATCGVLSPWNGEGIAMYLNLEKPVVINNNIISDFEITNHIHDDEYCTGKVKKTENAYLKIESFDKTELENTSTIATSFGTNQSMA